MLPLGPSPKPESQQCCWDLGDLTLTAMNENAEGSRGEVSELEGRQKSSVS